MRLLVERHPLLTYVARYPAPFSPPVLEPSPRPGECIPLNLSREFGGPGRLEGAMIREIDDAEALLQDRLNLSEEDFNADGDDSRLVRHHRAA